MPSSERRHPAYTQYRINRHSRSQISSDSASVNSHETPATEIDQETLDKPVLALNYRNRYLGGAAWRPTDSTLIILADTYCANVEDLINLGSRHCNEN